MTQPNRKQRRKVGRNTHVVAPLDPMTAHRIEAKRQENQRRARAEKEKRVTQHTAEADAKLLDEQRKRGEEARAQLEDMHIRQLGAAALERELQQHVAAGEVAAAEQRSTAFRSELAELGDSPADRARANALVAGRLRVLGLDGGAIGYIGDSYVPEERRYRDPLPRRTAADPRERARQDARLRAAGLTPSGIVLPGGGEHKSF